MDLKTSWKRVNDVLGSQKNNSPTELKIHNAQGQADFISDPMKLASELNNYFRSKINILHNKINNIPTIHPARRLMKWLESENIQTPKFQLKEIDRESLRKKVMLSLQREI